MCDLFHCFSHVIITFILFLPTPSSSMPSFISENCSAFSFLGASADPQCSGLGILRGMAAVNRDDVYRLSTNLTIVKGAHYDTPSPMYLRSCSCFETIIIVLGCRSYDLTPLLWQAIVSFFDLPLVVVGKCLPI